MIPICGYRITTLTALGLFDPPSYYKWIIGFPPEKWCLLAFSVRRGLASNTPKKITQNAEHSALEIGPEHETEMKGSSVEDHRTIDLDVKCYADYDKATPEGRYSSDKKLRTNLSSA